MLDPAAAAIREVDDGAGYALCVENWVGPYDAERELSIKTNP